MCTLRINRLHSDRMYSAVFLQQLQGPGHKEQIGGGWVLNAPTVPEVHLSVLHEPFLGGLKTKIHATTVGYPLWNGELHGVSTIPIRFATWRPGGRGSDIEILEGHVQ